MLIFYDLESARDEFQDPGHRTAFVDFKVQAGTKLLIMLFGDRVNCAYGALNINCNACLH